MAEAPETWRVTSGSPRHALGDAGLDRVTRAPPTAPRFCAVPAPPPSVACCADILLPLVFLAPPPPALLRSRTQPWAAERRLQPRFRSPAAPAHCLLLFLWGSLNCLPPSTFAVLPCCTDSTTPFPGRPRMPGAGHGNGGGEGGLPLARLPPDLPPQPWGDSKRVQTPGPKSGCGAGIPSLQRGIWWRCRSLLTGDVHG